MLRTYSTIVGADMLEVCSETGTRPRFGTGTRTKVAVKVSSFRMGVTVPRAVWSQSYCGACVLGSTRSTVKST